jgi:hypothetical protein
MTENSGGYNDPQVPPAPEQYPPAQSYPPPAAPPPTAPDYSPPDYSPPPNVPPAQTYPPVEGYPPPAQGYPPVADNAPPWTAPVPGQQNAFGGSASANLQNFDPKTVNPLDWGIMAAGLLALIFSFTSYYKYSLKLSALGISQSSSASVSAWHGFFGWFAAIVAFAAAALLAAHLIAKVSLPVPLRLVVLGGFALALLCALLALVVVPGNTGGAGAFGVKIDKGHSFGYWLSLLVLLAGTGLAFVRFQQTGGKLPGKRA